MANIDINEDLLLTQAGTDGKGRKRTFVTAETKAAQNDTITLNSASSIAFVNLQITATGAQEPYTISGNVITLTSATGGTVTGEIIFK